MNESGSTHLDVPAITNVATLFDTLSIDALAVIVRQMNIVLLENKCMWRLPSLKAANERRAPMCKRHELVRFLRLLYAENSPFRAAAATFVSQIELRWACPRTCFYTGARALNTEPEMFHGEAEEIELGRTIFSACGPYVRKIIVSHFPESGANAKDAVEQFTSHVFRCCRNVEEVEFCNHHTQLMNWGIAPAFFRKYAGNLRKIHWACEEDQKEMPDLVECVNLRSLKARNLTTSTLVSLLKACRFTLEELDVAITPAGDSAEVVEAIRKYCKKLSVINIENLEDVMDVVGQESYSALIRSYGTQLRNAKTDGLCHERLVEVVHACTNLEATVYWMLESNVDWQHVYDLGPRVASISFHGDLLHGSEYPRSLDQCSNLRKLYMSSGIGYRRPPLTDAMIANVFVPSRFPKLENVSVTNFRASERNMAMISSCTTNLKSACFEPCESDLEVSGFKFIADSNRRLKDIAVDMDFFGGSERSAKCALESLSELAKIFHKCRKLRFETSCWNEEEVEKEDLIRICKVLPCRDVVVFVRIERVIYRYPNLPSKKLGVEA